MLGSFQEQEVLAEIFDQLKNVDEQIFGFIFEIFRKKKVQDCMLFLSDHGNQKNLEQYILQNLIEDDNGQKLYDFRNNIKQITNVLKTIKDHGFNKLGYSNKEYEESTKDLIKGIKQ